MNDLGMHVSCCRVDTLAISQLHAHLCRVPGVLCCCQIQSLRTPSCTYVVIHHAIVHLELISAAAGMYIYLHICRYAGRDTHMHVHACKWQSHFEQGPVCACIKSKQA